jgi:hypothetical protein
VSATNTGGASEPPRAELTIINPDATPEEIAAITAVFAAMAPAEAPPRKPRSTWASYARRVRPPLHQGRGAWRASGLPR